MLSVHSEQTSSIFSSKDTSSLRNKIENSFHDKKKKKKQQRPLRAKGRRLPAGNLFSRLLS